MVPKIKKLYIGRCGRIAKLEAELKENSGLRPDMEFEFDDYTNVFLGRNGSGKTLLLTTLSYKGHKCYKDVCFHKNLRGIPNHDQRAIVQMTPQEYNSFMKHKGAVSFSHDLNKEGLKKQYIDAILIDPQKVYPLYNIIYHNLHGVLDKFVEATGKIVHSWHPLGFRKFTPDERKSFYWVSRNIFYGRTNIREDSEIALTENLKKPEWSQGKYLLRTIEELLEICRKGVIVRDWDSGGDVSACPIYCLDEIESGLDPLNQKRMGDLMKRFREESDVQLFLSTHSPLVVDRLHVDSKIFDLSSNPIKAHRRGDLNTDQIYQLTGYSLG